MSIPTLDQAFLNFDYSVEENSGITTYSNDEISFDFINQMNDGFECYVVCNGTKIKIDWTLEIYSQKRQLVHIVKSVGDKSKDDALLYLKYLVFDIGVFMVEKNLVEIEKFFSWYQANSADLYAEYLKLLGYNF